MAKLPTRKRIFSLVGEGGENRDGTSRQAELLACDPGEPVQLVREPNNQFDANAILVLSCRGIGIGYLGRDDAEIIAPALDSGRPHFANLNELRGGFSPYPNYGARICIVWDATPPLRHRPLDDEQLRGRRNKLAISARSRDAQGRLAADAAPRGPGCSVLLLVGIGLAAAPWW